jgi:hypothetical protein
MLIIMKKGWMLILSLFVYLVGYAQTTPGNVNDNGCKQVLLPNGWTLTPGGRSLKLGDLPLNIAVSASGKLLVVTNNGQGTQSI